MNDSVTYGNVCIKNTWPTIIIFFYKTIISKTQQSKVIWKHLEMFGQNGKVWYFENK